jgi:hypothetical protein
MEVDAHPTPPTRLPPPPPQVIAGKTIGLEDFVDDVALPHIIAILEQNSRLAAQKVEEW